MSPFYKSADGSVFHAMFPIDGMEETDGPIRNADGVDIWAERRRIRAVSVDGEPFQHCGICIKMVSDTCEKNRKCFRESFLEGKISETPSMDWYADADEPPEMIK